SHSDKRLSNRLTGFVPPSYPLLRHQSWSSANTSRAACDCLTTSDAQDGCSTGCDSHILPG
ncbi:hypothetical protein GOODEAATRI_016228, partial [Goodea atripinnis]